MIQINLKWLSLLIVKKALFKNNSEVLSGNNLVFNQKQLTTSLNMS